MGIFKKIFLIILLGLFTASLAQAQVNASFWQTKKSQHFIVYYQDAGEDFVNQLVDYAENYYNSIVDELGFRRMDFWSWDNRAKIYLFNNSQDYLKETRSAVWSGAQVYVRDRTIKTFIGQSSFFDSILPHELTHIIFREFVGVKINLALCLDEGIACSQEKSNLVERMKISALLIKQGTYWKFDKLFRLHNSTLTNPVAFYSESASIIVFLLKQYGRDVFLDFSRKIRDGVEWNKALFSVYRFNSFDEMENAWKDFMTKEGYI